MRKVKRVSQWLLAVFFVFGGLNHFRDPGFYLPLMPPYLPWHLPLVYLSGVAEITFGALLLVPGYTRWAAWGVIATLIAVFPANIHAAWTAGTPQAAMPDIAPLWQYVRLPFQGVFIAWAWWHTREIPGDAD